VYKDNINAKVKFDDLEEVTHNLGYYTASNLYNQPSGAYVFRSNEDEPYIIQYKNDTVLSLKEYKGIITTLGKYFCD